MESVPETWRDIPDHPGYQVSDRGQVRGLDRLILKHTRGGVLKHFTWKGRVLKQVNSKGYRVVNLGSAGYPIGVHRFVALAWIGPRPEGYCVNHKNGDKADNRPENLEYITSGQNVSHAHRTGLMKTRANGHGNAKLTGEQVAEIRTLFGTQPTGVIAKQFGVSTGHVRLLCRKTPKERIAELEARVRLLEQTLAEAGTPIP